MLLSAILYGKRIQTKFTEGKPSEMSEACSHMLLNLCRTHSRPRKTGADGEPAE